MLDHQRDQLAVAKLVLAQPELLINRLTLSQHIARLKIRFANQLGQLLSTQRLVVIIDLFKRNTALTEQFVQVTTCRSSRFFVDSYLVAHNYGKIPLTLVASATLPTASIYAPVRMSVLCFLEVSCTESKAVWIVVSSVSLIFCSDQKNEY
jgi:hypothetical protein